MWYIYISEFELKTTKLKKLFGFIRDPWAISTPIVTSNTDLRGPFKNYEEAKAYLDNINEWKPFPHRFIGTHVTWAEVKDYMWGEDYSYCKFTELVNDEFKYKYYARIIRT